MKSHLRSSIKISVDRIDYKNLSQARDHIEKNIFTQAASSPSLQAENFINEDQKVLNSERKQITA